MIVYKWFIYFTIVLILILLILIYILFQKNYHRKRVEKELRMKNDEVTAIYEEIAASDEELKQKIDELTQKQQALWISEERYRVVAESTMDIIWEGDLLNKKRIFSEKLYEILGYKGWEMEELDAWFNIVHPEDIEWVKEGIKQQIAEKVAVKAFEYRVKSKEGVYRWVLSNSKCEYDENGRPMKIFGAFTDITKLKEQQQKINYMAYYDAITALPNRAMFREVVSEEIKSCNEYSGKFALISIDLDNFKLVNDSYGHMTGDKLLIEIGKRLTEVLNENMTAFRLGGDEFVILVKDIESTKEIAIYSENLLESLANPISIDGNMFHITHSSGIAIYPENGISFNELLKNADTAMYKSKEHGKSTYTFYRLSMGDAAIEKIRMQEELERALKSNEFVLYYQPIVDVALGEVKGFEALIRWIHPQKGLVFPDEFISKAEESGQIIQMGKWVITSACKYAKRVYDSGVTNFYVSVNVSALQLVQKDFTDFVLSALEKVGLPPELLLIEITETALMESVDLVVKKLNILKDNNIKIALDDFGCGYSSLTYLKILPIDIVKIDRTFISDIKSEDDVTSMTGTIIILAKKLGLTVIGEGVETKEQLDYLKKHGCDMFQGYLVSKPVPEVEINKLLKII
jgi:diguanylate cyclase (GGDEF)-like protein/PAS domain S-box-containing protein